MDNLRSDELIQKSKVLLPTLKCQLKGQMKFRGPGEQSAFPDWASAFIMGLASWIGARTSQGAATGNWDAMMK